MTILYEKPFSFDFSKAVEAHYHDRMTNGDGNTFWPGVDFRVVEEAREIWLEVKSWSFPEMVDTTIRTTAKKDFQKKFDGRRMEEFRDEIVTKFLGTSAYLHWSGIGSPENVFYVVFLVPPGRSSATLLGPFKDRLRDKFKNAQARGWQRNIEYAVMQPDSFKLHFPQYPVEAARDPSGT